MEQIPFLYRSSPARDEALFNLTYEESRVVTIAQGRSQAGKARNPMREYKIMILISSIIYCIVFFNAMSQENSISGEK